MLSEEDLLAGAQADISDLDERALLADEREPKQEFQEELEDDGGDLYDAAIEPSGISEKRESVDSFGRAHLLTSFPVRRAVSSFMLATLTWWTTDDDLTSAIKSYGVEDILDIRFAENRQNGQSRGFATITVGSEASGKVVMDRLPGRQMHGNLISVLPFNKNSLQRLEDASKGSAPQDKKDEKSNIPNLGTVRIGQGVPMNMMNRQMQMGPMNGMNTMQPLMGFQNQMQMRPNNLMQQQPMMQGPPSLIQGMQQGNMMMQNRMFSGGQQQMNRMPQTNYPPPGVSQEIPPAEFEEIMSRNRTVSTSAITRAMNDAAAGDINGAVETLQTAISLIRQSKVSNSDACRNLIKTLEDALNSVESKEYSSRKHRRRDSSSPSRRRSRSRERSRESRSHRHSHKRSRAY
ncbi:hypothetical protein M3Y97_00714700 [Aphelenchoides bicaudatus]|nr:hypothetical protein M3Y97_00714700 [Aphelenchoides bicaudatus]